MGTLSKHQRSTCNKKRTCKNKRTCNKVCKNKRTKKNKRTCKNKKNKRTKKNNRNRKRTKKNKQGGAPPWEASPPIAQMASPISPITDDQISRTDNDMRELKGYNRDYGLDAINRPEQTTGKHHKTPASKRVVSDINLLKE